MNKHALFAAVTTLLCYLLARAQDFSRLAGSVIDAETREPLLMSSATKAC